ncbi:MAG: hypothetical protein RJA10_4416 [Pseudomonadota bacterium]|jgi:saccharopine dehydrogenase (NAD+, L-lysine-forming)
MSHKVLLYGAGGFSGRLVADLAHRLWGRNGRFEVLLGGRRAATLAPLAAAYGMPCRVFGLDDDRHLDNALSEPGLLAVINAAGPFSATAGPLARAAVRTGIHYVDLNGEADVYRRLDDLGYVAEKAGVTLVSGAGHCAATSDVMLQQALTHLAACGWHDIGNVRIAYSHVKYTSRGSAQTAWRSVREQVAVMRERSRPPVPPNKTGVPEIVIDHVPLGQLERSFDFGDSSERRRPGGDLNADHRIATACNLLDLYTARLTAQRHLAAGRIDHVRRIEAFIEMPEGARIFVQLGALSAPLLALPGMRRLVQAQVDLLPEGPDERERREDRHTVLLDIDDGCGQRLIDWRMETPDPYDFTAHCVLAVVEGLQDAGNPATNLLAGWRTPAELIPDVFADLGQLKSDGTARHPPGTMWHHCVFEPRFTLGHLPVVANVVSTVSAPAPAPAPGVVP